MGVAAAGASAAVGLIGAGVSAYSAYSQGQAQSKEAAYQAQVANNNATIATQKANYASAAAEEQATQESMKNASQESAIRAAIAANGVDVNSGSAEDVQESARETGELDLSNTLNKAMLQAYGYRSQSTNFAAQSGLDATESTEAAEGGELSAAGGFLGSASSIGSKWLGSVNNSSDPTQNLGFNTPTAATLENPD